MGHEARGVRCAARHARRGTRGAGCGAWGGEARLILVACSRRWAVAETCARAAERSTRAAPRRPKPGATRPSVEKMYTAGSRWKARVPASKIAFTLARLSSFALTYEV